jgi:hypothetical protein
MIKNLVELIRAVKELQMQDISEVVEDPEHWTMVVPLLSSSCLEFYTNASTQLSELVTAVEGVSGDLIFNEFGMVDPAVKNLLAKNKMEVVELEPHLRPLTHGLKTEKFIIPMVVD